MDVNNEILAEIKHLSQKLYGEDGYKGDIPEIKKTLEKVDECIINHEKRLNITETKQLSNRNLIYALWVVTAGIFTTLITMVLNHMSLSTMIRIIDHWLCNL